MFLLIMWSKVRMLFEKDPHTAKNRNLLLGPRNCSDPNFFKTISLRNAIHFLPISTFQDMAENSCWSVLTTHCTFLDQFYTFELRFLYCMLPESLIS